METTANIELDCGVKCIFGDTQNRRCSSTMFLSSIHGCFTTLVWKLWLQSVHFKYFVAERKNFKAVLMKHNIDPIQVRFQHICYAMERIPEFLHVYKVEALYFLNWQTFQLPFTWIFIRFFLQNKQKLLLFSENVNAYNFLI